MSSRGPSTFGNRGGLDALLAKLYCDHKGQWVKLTEPRGVQVLSVIKAAALKNKVKVDATSRTVIFGNDRHNDPRSDVYIYLKVSDLDEGKEISL